MVAEEGLPGKEGLGMGVGTVEPVFLCPPVHMCVVCGTYVCVCVNA